jgi:hypothetical protein
MITGGEGRNGFPVDFGATPTVAAGAGPGRRNGSIGFRVDVPIVNGNDDVVVFSVVEVFLPSIFIIFMNYDIYSI